MSLDERVEVPLVVVDEGARRVETEPEGIVLGVVALHGWEIHAIHAAPDVLGGQDAYLIKVNYELDLGSAFPVAMDWYEVGLEFAADDGSRPVTVVDALPRSAGPQEERDYTLNRRLQFVPCGAGKEADAVLPATPHRVDVFGVGGPQARWCNTAALGESVRPGSQVAWLSLFVPRGLQKVAVTLSVRYALPPEEALDVSLEHDQVTFSLALARDTRLEPTLTDTAAPDHRAEGPRLFICYGHDSDEHKASARTFARFLRFLGVEVRMDQYAGNVRQDWWMWAEREIREADYVAVLASPRCRAVGNGEGSSESHGMRTELTFIRELFAEDPERWTRKVLPIILPGEKLENLPYFLQPRNGTHYRIDEFSENDRNMKDLLRTLGRTDSGEWSSLPR